MGKRVFAFVILPLITMTLVIVLLLGYNRKQEKELYREPVTDLPDGFRDYNEEYSVTAEESGFVYEILPDQSAKITGMAEDSVFTQRFCIRGRYPVAAGTGHCGFRASRIGHCGFRASETVSDR